MWRLQVIGVLLPMERLPMVCRRRISSVNGRGGDAATIMTTDTVRKTAIAQLRSVDNW